MRVATEQRESIEDHHLANVPPARLGGTDIFRGALVILAAVVIGAIIIGQGLDGGDETTATDDVLPATDSTTVATAIPGAGTDTGADGQAPATDDGIAGGEVPAPATGDPATTDGTATTEDPAAPSTTEVAADPLATVRPPAEVRVLVLNGAGTQGIAARGTEMLQAASYLTAAPKNADALGASTILYIDGYAAEAQAVAAVFGPGLDAIVQPLDPAAPPVADLQDAAVVVVLGNDDVIPVA